MATGLGEEIWRFTLSVRVVEAMRRGLSAREACNESVQFMLRRKPETAEIQAAVIGVRQDGDHGAATIRTGFSAYYCLDGKIVGGEVAAR